MFCEEYLGCNGASVGHVPYLQHIRGPIFMKLFIQNNRFSKIRPKKYANKTF